MLERTTLRFNAAVPKIGKILEKIDNDKSAGNISFAHREFVDSVESEIKTFTELDPHDIDSIKAQANQLRENTREYLCSFPEEFVDQRATFYQPQRFAKDCCAELFNLTQLLTFISPRNDELDNGTFSSVITREALQGRKVYYSSSGYLLSDSDVRTLRVEQVKMFEQNPLSMPEKYALSHFMQEKVKYSMRMPMLLLRHKLIPSLLSKGWAIYYLLQQREACYVDPKTYFDSMNTLSYFQFMLTGWACKLLSFFVSEEKYQSCNCSVSVKLDQDFLLYSILPAVAVSMGFSLSTLYLGKALDRFQAYQYSGEDVDINNMDNNIEAVMIDPNKRPEVPQNHLELLKKLETVREVVREASI